MAIQLIDILESDYIGADGTAGYLLKTGDVERAVLDTPATLTRAQWRGHDGFNVTRDAIAIDSTADVGMKYFDMSGVSAGTTVTVTCGADSVMVERTADIDSFILVKGDGENIAVVSGGGGGGSSTAGDNAFVNVAETVDNINRRITLTFTKGDGSTQALEIDLPAGTALPPAASQSEIDTPTGTAVRLFTPANVDEIADQVVEPIDTRLTTVEAKLGTVESGAQVNVGVEYTQAEKTKLAGVEDSATANPDALDTVATDNTLGGTGTAADPLRVVSTGQGGGLTSVSTDSTLSGDGTSGSPLSVERPYPATEQTRLDNVVAGEQQNSNNIQSLQNSLAPVVTKVAGIEDGAEVNPPPMTQSELDAGTSTAERVVTPAFLHGNLHGGADYLQPAEWVSGTDYPLGALVRRGGHLYFKRSDAAEDNTIGPNAAQNWTQVPNNAEAYTPGDSYAQGDFTAYDNKVFVCLEPVTTSSTDTEPSEQHFWNLNDALVKLRGIAVGAEVNPPVATQEDIDNPDGRTDIKSFTPDQIDEIASQYGGGIGTVSHDSSLSGEGTAASPLSVANEFTQADEDKLDGIAEGANVGLTSVAVDGTTITGDGTVGNPLVSVGGGGSTTPAETGAQAYSETLITSHTFSGLTADVWHTVPNSSAWTNYDHVEIVIDYNSAGDAQHLYIKDISSAELARLSASTAGADSTTSDYFSIRALEDEGNVSGGLGRDADNNIMIFATQGDRAPEDIKVVGIDYGAAAAGGARWLKTRTGVDINGLIVGGIYIDGSDGKHYTVVESRNHAAEPLQVVFDPGNKLSATPFEVRGFAKENITNLVSGNLDAQADLSAVSGVSLQDGVPEWLNAFVNYTDDAQSQGDLFVAIDSTYTGNAPAVAKVKVGTDDTQTFNLLRSTSITSTGNTIYAASTRLQPGLGNIFGLAEEQTADQTITIDLLDEDGDSLMPNTTLVHNWREIDLEVGHGALQKGFEENKPLAKDGGDLVDEKKNTYVGETITTAGVVMHLNKKGGETDPLWGFDANRRTSVARSDLALTEFTYDENESVPEFRVVDTGISSDLRDGRMVLINKPVDSADDESLYTTFNMRMVVKPSGGHPDDEHALYCALNNNTLNNVRSPTDRASDEAVHLYNHSNSATSQWRSGDHIRFNPTSRRIEFDHERDNGETENRLMGIRIEMVRQGGGNSGRYRYHVPADSDAFALSSEAGRAAAAITPDIGDIPSAFRRFGIWALDIDVENSGATTNSLSFSAQFNENAAVFDGRKLGLIINIAADGETAPFKQVRGNNVFEMVLDPPLANNHAVYNFATGGSHPSLTTLPNGDDTQAWYVCPVILNTDGTIHEAWCPNIYTHMVIEGVEIPIELANITEDYSGNLGSQPHMHYQTAAYSAEQITRFTSPLPAGDWNCNFRTDDHIYHSYTGFMYTHLQRGDAYILRPQNSANGDLYASAEQAYWGRVSSPRAALSSTTPKAKLTRADDSIVFGRQGDRSRLDAIGGDNPRGTFIHYQEAMVGRKANLGSIENHPVYMNDSSAQGAILTAHFRSRTVNGLDGGSSNSFLGVDRHGNFRNTGSVPSWTQAFSHGSRRMTIIEDVDTVDISLANSYINEVELSVVDLDNGDTIGGRVSVPRWYQVF